MDENTTEIRTRLAPSPTGYPHIGTIYQALFDKAWADKNNGTFVLRIEDTDRSRFVDDAEDAIFGALNWFGLDPDESIKDPGDYKPYRQSERLELYKEFADRLLEEGAAYKCFCTKERLDEVRKNMQKEGKPPMYDKHCRHLSHEEVKQKIDAGEEYVIRMKVPEKTTIIVEDLIRGKIEFDSNLIDDQVIVKSDGFPTYHLAVVVDDFLMKISHVIRGPEWLTSFPKHKLLYDYLEIETPVMVHTPMITNMDGSKLSKRQGHSSVDWYRRKGYLPQAVLNFISLLGWSHPEEKEIFSYKEFVEKFDVTDISAVSPKFDLVKLDWMNGQYIQQLSDTEFIDKFIEWLEYCLNNEYKGASEFETNWNEEDYTLFLEFIHKLDDQELFAQINKERIKKFEELLNMNEFMIREIIIDEKLLLKKKSKDEVKEHLKWLLGILENIDWSLENLKIVEKNVSERADDLGWKVGEVFYPIRVAVTGKMISPPLFESMYLLGKNRTLNNLLLAINS